MTPSTAPAHGSAPIPVMRLGPEAPARFRQLLDAVARVAVAGAFTLGQEVEAFEAEWAAHVGSAHALGVSSGTEALVLALRALDIGPGDEVIVPANSFIATAEAVSLVGATPHLIDVDPATHLITAAGVEAAVGPATRCVIPVHLMGATVDMPAILAVAAEHGLRVVEDTAQAHGAWIGGRRAGAFGDLGCFSFYPTKNLGGWGDGGAVVTDDPVLADRVRLLRCHGERPRYHHRVVGTTARLDAVQAAVLRIKLRDLDAVTAERRRLGETLREGLADTRLGLPAPAFPDADHVYHLFVVRSERRDELRAHLATDGIDTAVHYPVAIHRTPAYAHLDLAAGSLPGVEALAEQSCTLPLFPRMSEDECARVITSIHTWDRRQG